MNGRVVKAQAEQASVLHSSHRSGCTATGRTTSSRMNDPVFGVALVDRHGNLLGAGTAGDLAGEVEVPPSVDLRKEDLRSYFDGGLEGAGGRRFPLVSATWVQVKSKRVRVGIYMESGEWLVNPERLDLDVGRIAAILSSQGVA
jgi:hypothetical protein